MKYRYREPHEMKDSGVEWLGMIPIKYKKNKLKYICKIFGRIGFRGYTVEDLVCEGEGAITLGPSNINDDKFNLDKRTYISWKKYEESPEIKIYNKDIILVKTASVGKVAIIENLNEKATINPQLIVLKKIKIQNKYLYYILISNIFQTQLKASLTGGVVPTLSQEQINNYIFYTDIDDKNQQKIADFLDKKCEEFDSVIAKKEMLINKLEEAKKSLISEVVTGKVKVIEKENGEYGIIKREDHEMKDSGVEWLGMIPKEWEVSRLKYHAIVMGGFAFSSNDFEDDGIQIIKISNLYMNELQLDRQPNYISKNSLDKFKNYIVTEGDILISLTGTLGKRDYGYAIFIKTKDIFLLNQRVGKITCKNTLFKEYLITLLHSEEYLNQLYSYPSGTKQANLSNEDVLNPILPIPSKKEQGLLIRYIAVKMNEIEKVNKKLNLQIEKLKLAKQSLISEAVTGKIEVL